MSLPMEYQRLITRARGKDKRYENDLDTVLYYVKRYNNLLNEMLAILETDRKNIDLHVLNMKLELKNRIKELKNKET